MDLNVKLVLRQEEPLQDLERYQRLVGKLNYLTITRPDISFLVSVVSRFLQSPYDSHWDAVIRILCLCQRNTRPRGVVREQMSYPDCWLQ